MRKSIQVLAVGSMIGLSTLSPLSVKDASAQTTVVASSEANLSALEIAEFELNQVFAGNVLDYTATVANSVSQMSLTLVTEDEDAVIAVNGESVTNNETTVLNLATGENVFTITLTDSTGVTTYTVTVNREANSDTTLSSLLLSNGNIDFSSSVNTYSVDVDEDVRSMTVVPTATASTSIVQVNGTVATASGVAVDLPVGRSTITLVVTAENGNQKTYLISVKRAQSAGSSNSSASANGTSAGSSSPSSSANSSAAASPTTLATSSKSSSTSATPTSSSSALSGGTQSGSASATTSTTANLASLATSSGTWDQSFDSEVYTYHLAVGTDVSSVTVSATAEESDAEIKIEGSTSTTVALSSVPKQVVSVTVTNENDQKTYVLIFEKDILTNSSSSSATTSTTETTDATATTTTTSAATTETASTTNNTTTQTSAASSEEETPSFWDWLKSLFGF